MGKTLNQVNADNSSNVNINNNSNNYQSYNNNSFNTNSNNDHSFNNQSNNTDSFISRNKEPLLVSVAVSLFCSILANLIILLFSK